VCISSIMITDAHRDASYSVIVLMIYYTLNMGLTKRYTCIQTASTVTEAS